MIILNIKYTIKKKKKNVTNRKRGQTNYSNNMLLQFAMLMCRD